MSSPAARERWRARRTAIVQSFCAKYGFSLVGLNNGYQLRVENLVDFYPVNGRYCILQSGERGDWNTKLDMKEIMLKALPAPKMNGRHADLIIFDEAQDLTEEDMQKITTIMGRKRWYHGRVWDWLNKRFSKLMIRLRWRGKKSL